MISFCKLLFPIQLYTHSTTCMYMADIIQLLWVTFSAIDNTSPLSFYASSYWYIYNSRDALHVLTWANIFYCDGRDIVRISFHCILFQHTITMCLLLVSILPTCSSQRLHNNACAVIRYIYCQFLCSIHDKTCVNQCLYMLVVLLLLSIKLMSISW